MDLRTCLAVLSLIFLPFAAESQSLYQWTWVGGPNTLSDPGSYGTQGVEDASNLPAARRGGATWTGIDGRLWLFGGSTLATGNPASSDLWTYNTISGLWTWRKGPSSTNGAGVYGTLGVSHRDNNPGARYLAASIVDEQGRLWLFGGYGRDAAGTQGYLNDLWRYDPATNEWTWIKGSSQINRLGVYGLQGTTNNANNPGGRLGAKMWRDAQGRFWLFGGSGYGSSNIDNYLNDLWRYDPVSNQWTWVKGSNSTSQYGTYGMQGVAAAANTPGARISAAVWSDEQGRLWLFGGFGYNFNQQGNLDDLWRFDPATTQWTWIKGTNLVNQSGIFGEENVADVNNRPSGRDAAAYWRDAQGRFWMYGGNGGGALADLWRYDPSSNLWTWVRGGNGTPQSAVYGVQGEAHARNRPGAKWQAHAWLDGRGRLLLFGGQSYSQSFGSGYQNDLWRFDPELVPAVTTNAASEVADNNARLVAAVNPNGEATNSEFRWGTDAALAGASTIKTAIPEAGTSAKPVSLVISNLAPSTRYYFQARATNSSGVGAGEILSFTTAATPPVKPGVTTTEASSVLKRSATLKGTVNPNGVATQVGFEWGLTPELGNFTGYMLAATGSTSQAQSFELTGLSPATTYYYRIRAENPTSFPQRGQVRSFTTTTAAVTEDAAQVSFTEALLKARLNPEGVPATAWFEYGTTPAMGSSTTDQPIGEGNEFVQFSAELTGLAPGQVYYFQPVMRKADGIERGGIVSFQTNAALTPHAQTVGSTELTTGSAVLIGKASANGRESVAYFEFGRTAEYGSTTAGKILSAEDVGGEYRVEVGGLEAHTKYFFRAVATNPVGRGYGEEGSFTTANTNPVGSNKVLHAPVAGVETVVYGVGDTADADGDERVLSVRSYTGAGSVTSTEGEIRYTGAGFVGSESLEVMVNDGFGGSAVATVTLRNEAPHAGADHFNVGAGESWLEVLGNDGDADGDTLRITAVSEAGAGTVTSDGQRLSYTPGAGFRGVDVFSYTISDGRGGSASAQVTVVAGYSVPGSVAVNKESVPGVSGGRWTRFGAPSLFAGGTRAGWLAWVNSASGRFQGIFSGGIGEPVLRVRSGDSARAEDGSVLRGVKFSKFEEPVFAGGRFAFMARVNGPGGSELEQTGVWVSEQGTLRAIGREGEMAPGTNGAKFRAFNAVAMPGADAVFFKAKLEIGKGGVSEANATGLWVWSTTGTRLALRQGQAIDFGQGVLRVRSFEVLQAMASAPGQGGYDAATQRVDALITFSNNSVAIASIGLDASIRVVALTGEPDPAGRLPAKFGTPSSPGYGQLPVAVVTFEAGKAKLTEKNNQAVYDFEQERIIAQEGAEAPGATAARFLSFENAVAGYGAEGERVTAFVATLGGVQAKANVGLWAETGTEAPQQKLVAQKGAEPPGAPGTRFQRFESVSVMEGRGTLFKAKLASGTTKVTPANDEGLWGTDSTGTVRLLLRKGQLIAGKTLRTFTLLHEVPRSAAQRRSWTSADPTATLLYLAYFSDGSSAILSTTLP